MENITSNLGKNNQIENLQDNKSEKSALPNDEKVSSNDLDDEIPF